MPENRIKITSCRPSEATPLVSLIPDYSDKLLVVHTPVSQQDGNNDNINYDNKKRKKLNNDDSVIILRYPQHEIILELEGACKPTIRMLLDHIESGLLEKILQTQCCFRNMWIHLSVCG